ncbi:MAG: hypothetical protein JRJ00_07560 [Deltaproteobacteria bacterium]|nr:hypothetical protein [Deltaproteobacteria bacterium]
MCDVPSFLPPMLNLDGEWNEILSLLYNVFAKDFKDTKTYHRGTRVIYNGTIEPDGLDKEEGFWHMISKKDKISGDRLIDYPRAKRLSWAKPLMQSPKRQEIKFWQYREGTADKGVRTYIWLEDYNYALILQRKKNVFYWITAFYVDSWKQKDLRRKYENRT